MENEEIAVLVKMSKNDNLKAFEKLYEYIYKDLYRFAFYTLKNQYDAEDVVSETVVDAFESIKKLKKEEAFKSWMFKILVNKCKKKFKQYAGKMEKIDENFVFPMTNIERIRK